MAKYGSELTAVTLCGTAGEFPGLEQGMAILDQAVKAGLGESSDPDAAGALMGWLFARFPEGVRYGNEWICSVPFVQMDHATDPMNAFTRPTTNRAFLYFCQMIDCITGEEWAEKVPKELPVYNIAGSEDPVGLYGEGVRQVSAWLDLTGHDVVSVIYEGYRHEIHNYTDIRDMVEDNILRFFQDVMDR